MNFSRKQLVLIGWLMIIGVVVLSLVPIGAVMPDAKGSDKIGHFIAYFSLMAWFSWLYPRPIIRNFYAIGFIFMGGLLEVLQSITKYRSMDIDDFHVNTIGVVVGFVFAVLTSQLPIVKKVFKL